MFGFGSSKSSSQSSSSSDQFGIGYGYSGSGSESGGVSGSVDRSGGSSSSRDTIAFNDIYSQFFGAAQGATARAADAIPALQGQAGELFNAGAGFLESLSGPSAVDARLNAPGTADAQIGILGDDIKKFLSESILPEIGARGIAAGQYGGSRGEVARGIAAEGAIGEFQRGATAIRTADVQRRDQLARASDEGVQARSGIGLSALPGLFDLASGGANAGLSPYLALAQILGGPTVLGESESEQFGFGDAFSENYATSSAFGEDFDYNTAHSESQSTGKSKSFSLSAGPGG